MLTQLLANILMFVIAASGCLIVGALAVNNLPMGDHPGFWVRFKTYLTTNVAETKRNHPFPELELPVVQMPSGVLLTRLELTIDMLGWTIVEADPQKQHIHAVVETALLRFKDDVEIQLQSVGKAVELHIKSQSRTGRGDLGANTRHILDLLELLARQV